MENVDIDKTLASNIASSDNTDSAFNAIKKYNYHSSIKKIKHIWRKWGTPQNFLLAFIDELWKTWKMRILKKWKNQIAGDIIILHMCTKSHNHMKYSSWDTQLDRIFFSFCAIFCTFTPTPLTTQKTKILKKWKKHLEMSSFKLVQQKTQSYDVCLLWYGVRQTQFFVILGHFLLFYPTIDNKN